MVMKIANNPIKIYALGGLGEVGKNTYCIESERHLIIIDAGVKFPEDDLVGVDYVIPNYTHLKNNQGKIRALFITHGHEDHIGAIPFLVKAIKVPVIYAPRLAAALIRQKLEEKKCKEKVNIIEYDENSNIVAGEFNVSFFRVTHSIPDSFGICVDTSEGRIVTTGDFKIDLTPVGPDIQIAKMADIGESGVDLLLADSTNAEKEGWTPSERNVINSINEIFDKAPGRLIISTFSSNVSRIQQIVESTILHHRKLVVVGRSMVNTLEYARKFGYIKIPTTILRTVETMHDCKDSEMVILCTGSQGEPMAALSRIANGTFKNLHIIPGDTVVFSSSPIPGNGTSINKVVNLLTRLGADVITNSVFSDIHSSGHPSRKELQLNLKLFNPKYFMPAHGEYHMLKLHADLAKNIGIPPENIFVLGNGDTLVLNNTRVMPARIIGEKAETGGKIEFLLLKRIEGDKWECLAKPGKRAKIGAEFTFGEGKLKCTVVDIVEEGNRIIEFSYDGIFEQVLDELGEMPLPPYITERLDDRERYQTVYSKEQGSAAAPTAGLHFTKELLEKVKEKGVNIAYVTLHVGLGTFRPVSVENIEEHEMHSEFYSMSASVAKLLNETKKSGHNIVAVGTTSTRTLETIATKYGEFRECNGWTNIFIYPGYEFKGINKLITNFHLPKSTLVMLVSALAGRENILNAYKIAVEDKYRFFSFGDAMFIK